MCTSHARTQADQTAAQAGQADAGRRNFLRATALIGAAATTVALPAAARAAAREASRRPDPESRRFTLAVMPDTQYLFDGPSINPAPIEASLRYLLEHGKDENIVFLSHLGDLTENGGDETVREQWWHVAVVNDGSHTTMYVQGCPVARNPHASAVGLTSLGLPWLLGGYEYAGKIDQILHGRLGDVRIVERALPVTSFMNH
ncbi:LamG-like jellyroll fold domain-containing protein [Streptomyces sp. NBC_00996]|uniref:LamG-like jellyroll fold domain-containing protein n=1 Tax=Streptomyces sp. NBC_00996 TaxID=2903710 RepID=UPI003863AA7A|nr:hypothetical protein OG390_43315 [Streptomyces sp. NBC_00996]